VPLYQGGAEHAQVRQARQSAQQARQVVEDQRRRWFDLWNPATGDRGRRAAAWFPFGRCVRFRHQLPSMPARVDRHQV
jgi:hypothetical protein